MDKPIQDIFDFSLRMMKFLLVGAVYFWWEPNFDASWRLLISPVLFFAYPFAAYFMWLRNITVIEDKPIYESRNYEEFFINLAVKETRGFQFISFLLAGYMKSSNLFDSFNRRLLLQIPILTAWFSLPALWLTSPLVISMLPKWMLSYSTAFAVVYFAAAV